MPTLNWIGKEKVINHHLDVPFKVLEHIYGIDKGIKTEKETKSGNKIIHGDNLEALKALLPEYDGAIKCIYIDPPYNTGEENWVYNDNVTDPKIEKWLGQIVGKEAEDLTRHDKWLCMIYPRLKLLHKLLADDGIIFISCDDNEQGSLKIICNEVFGTSNFVTNFIWEKRTNRENRKEISYRHDYILVYRKNKYSPNSQIKKLEMSGEALDRYKNPDNDPEGVWKSDPATAQSGHATKSQFYTLKAPNGKEHNLQSGRCWVYNEDVMNDAIHNNKIWFGKNGNGVPRIKTYLNSKVRGLVPETIWFASDVGTNESAKVDLKSIFNGKAAFPTPKPTRLIERILQISSDKNSIILDSFAGSGTTAHAVLNLNQQDGGNRKFICIEMMDYAETITSERVKRVIKGYGTNEGIEGGFDYYELGQPIFINQDILNEEIPLKKIHEYVWYSETKTKYVPTLNNEIFFLGKFNDTSIYFYYEKDQVTALDDSFLRKLRILAQAYIIYADICLLDNSLMEKYHIVFKKIPRDITRF